VKLMGAFVFAFEGWVLACFLHQSPPMAPRDMYAKAALVVVLGFVSGILAAADAIERGRRRAQREFMTRRGR